MKKIALLISSILIISCSQKENQHAAAKLAEEKKIDSINEHRKKYNDSISILNAKNQFKDLSGKHQFTFTSDEIPKLTGNINFENTGRDLYTVSGKTQSGKNTVNIDGEIRRVSEKHLNFEGKIKQNINGKSYTRTKKTTFFDEGKGNFWRLQDKVNNSGFIDYIDISF